MAKATTFCIMALLLCYTLCSAARPVPDKVQAKHEVKAEGVKVEDNCAGISEEECLMRKTQMAHLDYIYTQRQNP